MTDAPRALISLPSEAAVRPLPSELETPPVTKRNLVGEEGGRASEVEAGEDEEAAEGEATDGEAADEEKLAEEVGATCWLSPLIPASVFTGFNLTAICAEIGNLLQFGILSAQQFSGVLLGRLAFGRAGEHSGQLLLSVGAF